MVSKELTCLSQCEFAQLEQAIQNAQTKGVAPLR